MFEESIKSQLTLTIDGQEHKVIGGNVKHCKINLARHGFSGEVGFYLSNEVSDDALIDAFIKDELIEIEITLAQHSFSKAKPGNGLVIKGLVGQRHVEEKQFQEVKDSKVLYRYYHCQLLDPAQFIWQQHFPSVLYVKQTLTQVVQAQIVNPIQLEIDWPHFDDERPMICLGMGAIGVSFYQFLLWYLAQYGGYLIYDYEQHSYKICNEKPEAEPEIKLAPEQVSCTEVVLAEPSFQSVNLLNGEVNLASTDVISEHPSVSGVRHDSLIVASIKQDAEAIKQREKQFVETRKPELAISLSQWPLEAMFPGAKIKLDHPKRNPNTLSTKEPFRLFATYIELEALQNAPMDDLHQAFSGYRCCLSHRGEAFEEAYWPRPTACLKPFKVQGEIVSEVGEEQDKTYQYHNNDDTQQLFYRVRIPLWEDQEILIRFLPDFLHPHFYFPLYKGTQVELQMDLFEARITRVLDWGARVFLEQETQGNHLIFGKNDKDETRLKYDYQDEKPVLSLERIKDKDTELVQLEEGKITFRTKEQD